MFKVILNCYYNNGQFSNVFEWDEINKYMSAKEYFNTCDKSNLCFNPNESEYEFYIFEIVDKDNNVLDSFKIDIE